MGLGPSIKMTTLHHFRCPVSLALQKEKDLEFSGIIVNGVSEGFDEKVFTAERTGYIAECMRADGAIVAIDGWGNHHIDFVNVMEQLGLKGIPAVGLSYIGQQGRLVCTNQYVDTVVDFNKNSSGYESCVVGDNNLTDYDAMKAVALLKNKMNKWGKKELAELPGETVLRRLTQKKYAIQKVAFGDRTTISRSVLTLRKGIEERILEAAPRIKGMTVRIVQPGEHSFFVNSNLDYMPIACKTRGSLGEGETNLLTGVTVMLTGVEDISGFQPSNIGSSEGIFEKQVKLNQAGTPADSDVILHIDFLFTEGEGRTAKGIQAAHQAADQLLNEIRGAMGQLDDMPYTKEEFCDVARPGLRKVILVKVVSGLGNMYDTSVFPEQPGGYIGSRLLMSTRNMPVVITSNQCMDGAIHSLL